MPSWRVKYTHIWERKPAFFTSFLLSALTAPFPGLPLGMADPQLCGQKTSVTHVLACHRRAEKIYILSRQKGTCFATLTHCWKTEWKLRAAISQNISILRCNGPFKNENWAEHFVHDDPYLFAVVWKSRNFFGSLVIWKIVWFFLSCWFTLLQIRHLRLNN